MWNKKSPYHLGERNLDEKMTNDENKVINRIMLLMKQKKPQLADR